MIEAEEDMIERATAPARWLLELGIEGIRLTQTNALARAVVRESVERWPEWWREQIEFRAKPNREAEVRRLEALHAGLRRLGLMRRRSGRLRSIPRGRELLEDPAALLLAASVLDALALGMLILPPLAPQPRCHLRTEISVGARARAFR